MCELGLDADVLDAKEEISSNRVQMLQYKIPHSNHLWSSSLNTLEKSQSIKFNQIYTTGALVC